jgi:hypothetical protein
MTAATHTAALVLELYAVDDEHAREIVSLAAASVVPLGGILALEASPPARRRHQPGSLDTNSEQQGEWLSTHDLELIGTLARGYLAIQDKLARPGVPHRNRIEELLDRLGVDDLAVPDPHPGEVHPLHRGSRA